MVAATVSHTLGGMLEALGRLDLLIIDPIRTKRGSVSPETKRHKKPKKYSSSLPKA